MRGYRHGSAGPGLDRRGTAAGDNRGGEFDPCSAVRVSELVPHEPPLVQRHPRTQPPAIRHLIRVAVRIDTNRADRRTLGRNHGLSSADAVSYTHLRAHETP